MHGPIGTLLGRRGLSLFGGEGRRVGERDGRQEQILQFSAIPRAHEENHDRWRSFSESSRRSQQREPTARVVRRYHVLRLLNIPSFRRNVLRDHGRAIDEIHSVSVRDNSSQVITALNCRPQPKYDLQMRRGCTLFQEDILGKEFHEAA